MYVKPLPASEWMEMLKANDDRVRGRADTMSLAFSKAILGRGAEAKWHSDSMDDADLPFWLRNATCGAPPPSTSSIKLRKQLLPRKQKQQLRKQRSGLRGAWPA